MWFASLNHLRTQRFSLYPSYVTTKWWLQERTWTSQTAQRKQFKIVWTNIEQHLQPHICQFDLTQHQIRPFLRVASNQWWHHVWRPHCLPCTPGSSTRRTPPDTNPGYARPRAAAAGGHRLVHDVSLFYLEKWGKPIFFTGTCYKMFLCSTASALCTGELDPASHSPFLCLEN